MRLITLKSDAPLGKVLPSLSEAPGLQGSLVTNTSQLFPIRNAWDQKFLKTSAFLVEFPKSKSLKSTMCQHQRVREHHVTY